MTTSNEPHESVEPPAEDLQSFTQALHDLKRRPLVTLSLVAANAFIFVAMVVSGVSVITPDIPDLLAWGANFGPNTLAGEVWRLLTSTFIHIGIIHVLFNMWVLWDAGRLVERLMGSGAFLVMYVLAGLGGSVASVTWDPLVVSAGASGAVFGVFGALFAIVLRKRPHVPPAVLNSVRNSSLAFIGYNLLYGVTVPGIDMAAHIGGLLVGFLVAMGLAMSFEQQRHLARRRVPMVAVTGLAMLAVVFALAPNRSVSAVDQDLKAFAQTEATVNQRFNTLLQGAQAGTVSDAEFARVLRDEISPSWDAGLETLTGYTDLPSKLQGRMDAIVAYARKRSEAHALFIRAMDAQDASLAASAQRALQESNEMAAALIQEPE